MPYNFHVQLVLQHREFYEKEINIMKFVIQYLCEICFFLSFKNKKKMIIFEKTFERINFSKDLQTYNLQVENEAETSKYLKPQEAL